MEELLLGLIAAAMTRRSVLVSSSVRNDKVCVLTQRALEALFGGQVPIIKCERITTWDALSHDLRHAAAISNYTIILRPQNLDSKVQACLAEYVPTSNGVLVFVGSSRDLARILRTKLLFQLFLQLPKNQNLNVEADGSSLDLEQLRSQAAQVYLSPEIKRYVQDAILFIRTHRFVSKGVPPSCIKEMYIVIQTLAVFGGFQFATPDLAIAALKMVMPLKIELCEASDDIALEYGGDLDITGAWLKNWDPRLLVDTVIEGLQVPV